MPRLRVALGGAESHPSLPHERWGSKRTSQRSDTDGNTISKYSSPLPRRTWESRDNTRLGGKGGVQRWLWGPAARELAWQAACGRSPSSIVVRSSPHRAGPPTRDSRLAPAPPATRRQALTPLPPPNFLLQGTGAPRAVTSRRVRSGGCPRPGTPAAGAEPPCPSPAPLRRKGAPPPPAKANKPRPGQAGTGSASR